MDKKQTIFSGIQPTGTFHIGNYFGAVKSWPALQDEYNCIYSIVDMHAITVRQVPSELRAQSLNCYALLLACGLDPERSLVFIQSHVAAHAQLAWILNCYTQFGELSRMTQFKDKSAKNADNINAGLFTYPSLMAADILLYGTDVVPVGVDQRQHLELARNIAVRFNGAYSETFTVPEALYQKVGAKIMSLSDPTSKMSKSDPNPNGVVTILESKDEIIKKFKRAVTDSDNEIVYKDGKDGINNLLSIYSAATGKSIEESVREFQGKGYGDFKIAVGEAVADSLASVRERHAQLMADKEYLAKCYTKAAVDAERVAFKMLSKVYKKVGFVPFDRRILD